MLSASSLPYIEASVPVLRAHGGEISKVFYRNLFDSHPELTQLFNMGNQAAGTQQQALAAALFAYAANIHNTDALGPVINRIVHKHASVGVCPAHYPIVGQFLIGAIKDKSWLEVAKEQKLFKCRLASYFTQNQFHL